MERNEDTDMDCGELTGRVVRLTPLEAGQWRELWRVAEADGDEIFRWFPYAMQTEEDFARWEAKALGEAARGESRVFVTRDAGGRAIGSTRFMNIDRANRRAEIGSTWIATAWQRTAVNSEAKYLMLRQAFEGWNCARVELKTDRLNQRSRQAILRLGAREEGTLRQHILTHSGRWRDTVYFSILDAEWPAVKARMEARAKE